MSFNPDEDDLGALAAPDKKRNGLTEVFVPLRNEPDLDDVPTEVLEAVTVHEVADFLDVIRHALAHETAGTLAA